MGWDGIQIAKIFSLFFYLNASGYDKEMPPSQTTDHPCSARKDKSQTDNKRTIKLKQPADFFPQRDDRIKVLTANLKTLETLTYKVKI